jgi:hypothetical protein
MKVEQFQLSFTAKVKITGWFVKRYEFRQFFTPANACELPRNFISAITRCSEKPAPVAHCVIYYATIKAASPRYWGLRFITSGAAEFRIKSPTDHGLRRVIL